MPKFMLLLYHDNPAGWAKLSPEEMQKAIEKYEGWSKKPFTKGSLRLAHDNGKVLSGKGGKPRATDGPFIESKEALGGFYIIEADDYDAAVKLALTHPQLEYGGTIEIRQAWAGE